jgi:hypothetical protein
MSVMKSAVGVGFVVSFLILVVTGFSSAEIPKKINYQGRVTDGETGSPLPGAHEMTFRVYDDSEGGSLLWSETQTLQADSAGVLSGLLGADTAIDIIFDGPVWLEVEVGGEILRRAGRS